MLAQTPALVGSSMVMKKSSWECQRACFSAAAALPRKAPHVSQGSMPIDSDATLNTALFGAEAVADAPMAMLFAPEATA